MITAINRYFQGYPNLVGISTTDDYAVVTAPGYFVGTQTAEVQALKNGTWQWEYNNGVVTDLVLMFYATGELAFFTYDASSDTFFPLTSHSGSGTVNPGTANQMAYYATSGTAVSGLATGNSGVLVTSLAGVPSISATLPADLTIPTPIINSVIDASLNNVLAFGSTASAVNYVTITNQVTGTPPGIQPTGSDTNIGIDIYTKGTGVVTLITGALSNAFTIQSGTGSQHTTQFDFSNTAATRTITWPDASGTVALVSGGFWALNTNASIFAAVNNGYVVTAGPATVILPSTFGVGDLVGIQGANSFWTAVIAGGTNVQTFANTYTSAVSSTGDFDAVVFIGVIPNTTWAVLQMQAAFFSAS